MSGNWRRRRSKIRLGEHAKKVREGKEQAAEATA
jgi:hypothetical protein